MCKEHKDCARAQFLDGPESVERLNADFIPTGEAQSIESNCWLISHRQFRVSGSLQEADAKVQFINPACGM